MRGIQELLDQIVPFVVLPYKRLSDMAALDGRQYVHELELEPFSLKNVGEEVLSND